MPSKATSPLRTKRIKSLQPWHGHRIWRTAPFEFDALTFLKLWHTWLTDAHRSEWLHVIAWTPRAPTPQALIDISRNTPWQALGEELAAQSWGLLLGLHRLRLNQGRSHLSLYIGEREELAELLTSSQAGPCESKIERHSVTIIGSGIAGAASARALAERGWQVRVLDAGQSPAAGASGLPVGLVAPHTSPDDALMSQLSRAGVRCMHQTLQRLLIEGQDWGATGVQERRLPGKTRKGGAPQSWTSPELAHAAQAWTHADDSHPHALWHRQGAWVKPAQLVKALLDHPNIEWQGDCHVDALRHAPASGGWQVMQGKNVLAESDRVVVAAGPDSAALLSSATDKPPPIQPLRGQLSWGLMQDVPHWVGPAHPVNGNGSFVSHIPTPEGLAWFAGSTFDRHRNNCDVFEEDNQENFTRLQALLADTAQNLAPLFASPKLRGWARVRASVPDRLPLVGAVAGAPEGLWTVCALGSRGLTLGVLCGELLAGLWHNEPLAVPDRLLQALSASRFAKKIKP